MLEAGGLVVLRSSTCPHGQGHETVFAQIAAERLGVAMDDVLFEFGDSSAVPPGAGTFASRSVAMGGSAVALAIDRLREECVRVGARLLGVEERTSCAGRTGA